MFTLCIIKEFKLFQLLALYYVWFSARAHQNIQANTKD